jgi:hypothetical protein
MLHLQAAPPVLRPPLPRVGRFVAAGEAAAGLQHRAGLMRVVGVVQAALLAVQRGHICAAAMRAVTAGGGARRSPVQRLTHLFEEVLQAQKTLMGQWRQLV